MKKILSITTLATLILFAFKGYSTEYHEYEEYSVSEIIWVNRCNPQGTFGGFLWFYPSIYKLDQAARAQVNAICDNKQMVAEDIDLDFLESHNTSAIMVTEARCTNAKYQATFTCRRSR